MGMHLKLRSQMELITMLARKIALAGAQSAPWESEQTEPASDFEMEKTRRDPRAKPPG
jgi:hypothetical protein